MRTVIRPPLTTLNTRVKAPGQMKEQSLLTGERWKSIVWLLLCLLLQTQRIYILFLNRNFMIPLPSSKTLVPLSSTWTSCTPGKRWSLLARSVIGILKPKLGLFWSRKLARNTFFLQSIRLNTIDFVLLSSKSDLKMTAQHETATHTDKQGCLFKPAPGSHTCVGFFNPSLLPLGHNAAQLSNRNRHLTLNRSVDTALL